MSFFDFAGNILFALTIVIIIAIVSFIVIASRRTITPVYSQAQVSNPALLQEVAKLKNSFSNLKAWPISFRYNDVQNAVKSSNDVTNQLIAENISLSRNSNVYVMNIEKQIDNSLISLKKKIDDIKSMTDTVQIKFNKFDKNPIALYTMSSSELDNMMDSYYTPIKNTYGDIFFGVQSLVNNIKDYYTKNNQNVPIPISNAITNYNINTRQATSQIGELSSKIQSINSNIENIRNIITSF